MSNYPDSSPNSGASKGGRKSVRVSSPNGIKNNDGRLNGDYYDGQCDNTEGNLPQRTASRNAKKTYDPNEDAPSIAGGTAYASKRREGLEEGAY